MNIPGTIIPAGGGGVSTGGCGSKGGGKCSRGACGGKCGGACGSGSRASLGGPCEKCPPHCECDCSNNTRGPGTPISHEPLPEVGVPSPTTPGSSGGEARIPSDEARADSRFRVQRSSGNAMGNGYGAWLPAGSTAPKTYGSSRSFPVGPGCTCTCPPEKTSESPKCQYVRKSKEGKFCGAVLDAGAPKGFRCEEKGGGCKTDGGCVKSTLERVPTFFIWGYKYGCYCSCPDWPEDPLPDHCYVRVLCGDLVWPFSLVGLHCWVETRDCSGMWNRYEVLQQPNGLRDNNVRASRYPSGPEGIGTERTWPIRVWPHGGVKINYAENHPCGERQTDEDLGNPCRCIDDVARNFPRLSYYFLPNLVTSKRAGNSNTFAAALFRVCVKDSSSAVAPGTQEEGSVFRRGSIGAGLGFSDERLKAKLPHLRPYY